MIKTLRTDSQNLDFKSLLGVFDRELTDIYGEVQSTYDKFNTLESIKNVIILFKNEEAIACGSFKKYNVTTVEIKRMFVEQKHRGEGYSKFILKELELWAAELGFNHAILETGIEQKAAINLYKNYGYTQIKNYDQYKNIKTSICFSKELSFPFNS